MNRSVLRTRTRTALSNWGNRDRQGGPIRSLRLSTTLEMLDSSSSPRERCEALGALTDAAHFRVYGKEFALACGFGLTDGDETFPFGWRIRWIAPSSTNKGGVGQDVEIREIPFSLAIRQRTRRWDTTRCVIGVKESSTGYPRQGKRPDPKLYARCSSRVMSALPARAAKVRTSAPLKGFKHLSA